MKVKRTERGWAGHFICASRCAFRRNTLLELNDVRIVVSTVGNYRSESSGKEKIETIGSNRYYETMAFYAHKDGPYWEADVQKQIDFEADWGIWDKVEADSDLKADDMHEKVVKEIVAKLESGETYEPLG